jgi:tRNA(Ile)-lysidine synthase
VRAEARRAARMLRAAVQRIDAPVVLAVSGGADSFALLAAMQRWAVDAIACVATFDHGTGDAATRACDAVAAWCRAHGVPVLRERATQPLARSEAAWRRARWAFLGRVAAERGVPVATAHTRDDQTESVCMRLLRGSGVRGLAALAARGPVRRPLLRVPRSATRAWAAAQRLPFVDDPANADPRFLRTRVRHALLPALVAHDPAFADWLVALGDRAADWRTTLAAIADARLVGAPASAADIPDAWCSAADGALLAPLWAEALARHGVTLDRRGTDRLVSFTTERRTGREVPVSGHVRVRRVRDGWRVVRVAREGAVGAPLAAWMVEGAPLVPPRLAWGEFSFQNEEGAPDAWSARLPRHAALVLRAWRPGDRIAGTHGTRRVVRFFQEQGIPATLRRTWPVIAIGDEIVWVPGVARNDAHAWMTGDRGDGWHCERRADG